MGAPMMLINTNHVLTQPIWYLMHYIPINDSWSGSNATFNHYNPIIAPIHVTI